MKMNMKRRIVIGALGFTLLGMGFASSPEAKNKKELRGSATWTVNPPEPCGAFSTLFVHSTAADASVVEVIYQFGNSCDGSFHSLQGSATASVTGNLQHLRMDGLIPTGDGRSFDVDLTLKRTKDFSNQTPTETTVSARATGSVVLDGADLTGGAPTTNATITETRTK
jgi:hypothetical protein